MCRVREIYYNGNSDFQTNIRPSVKHISTLFLYYPKTLVSSLTISYNIQYYFMRPWYFLTSVTSLLLFVIWYHRCSHRNVFPLFCNVHLGKSHNFRSSKFQFKIIESFLNIQLCFEGRFNLIKIKHSEIGQI